MYSYYFPCDQASSFLARFFQDPYFKIRKKKMNYGRKVIHCSLLSGYCYQQMVTNISCKEKRLQCHQGITWRETTKCQALLQWRKQKKQEQVSFPNTGHICLLHSLIIFTDSWPSCDRLAMFLSQNYLYIQWPRLQDLSVFHTCPPPVAPIFLCVFEWPWEAGWPFIFHLFITPWNPQSILCSREKKNALRYQKLKSK